MKYDVTSRYVLAEDAIVVPVTALSSALREKFEHSETDFAVTRRNSRHRSKIVDAHTGALLKLFESPSTLIDALTRYGETIGQDPGSLINAVGPFLLKLIDSQVLTVENSSASKRTTALLHPGDRAGSFRVQRIIKLIDDCEVYQGTWYDREAVVKLARTEAVRGAFENEANILRELPAGLGPALLETGERGNLPFLILERVDGVSPDRFAKQLRAEADPESITKLLAGCHSILSAYAALHDAGFLHGDVHPRNIVVDKDGSARLIDFALAKTPTSNGVGRGGVEAYYEPEAAEALLVGKPMPPNSTEAEQYAVAALLYELLTGAGYLHFAVGRSEMLRQIANSEPVPFAMRGLFGYSALQAVLARALAKDPSARFGSVAEFAAAFKRAAHSSSAPSRISFDDLEADRHVKQFVEQAGAMDGEIISAVFLNSPSCSVAHGAAGVAYSLYRLASRFANARLLSSADVWIQRALSSIESPDAFYNASLDLVPATIGDISLFHGAPGVHCVHALISGSMGDRISQRDAITNFLSTRTETCRNSDLTIGRSGLLLGATLMLDAAAGNDFVDSEELLKFGSRLLLEIWETKKKSDIEMLGLAHGLAGMAYATLRWTKRTKSAVPPAAQQALCELEALAEPWALGLRWKRLKHGNDYVPSWCNGAAGFVHLWTEAYQATGREAFLDLAKGAAETAWQDPDPRASLCCGYAGRAYALLNMYKYSGDPVWRDRACQLEPKAREASGYSLLNGVPGSVLLASDLGSPTGSCMPMFESDQGVPVR